MYECIGCESVEFESKPDLEAHVAAIHFDYLPYECEKCKFAKFPTEYAIRYHCEFVHQINDYCIRYRVSPELISKREQITDYVQQCMSRNTGNNQEASYDNEILEEKPNINLESTITETDGNFPSTSISPALKELFGAVELSPKTILGDAIKQMKRKRAAIFAEQPSSSSSKNSTSKEPSSPSPVLNAATVECVECKRVIANQATSVMYHTNSRHLQLPVFTCTPCNRIWTTISRSDLLRHVKNFHNNDMSVIVDKKEEYIIKIKEKCRQLFPNRIQMISKRRCYDNSVATNEETSEMEQE